MIRPQRKTMTMMKSISALCSNLEILLDVFDDFAGFASSVLVKVRVNITPKSDMLTYTREKPLIFSNVVQWKISVAISRCVIDALMASMMSSEVVSTFFFSDNGSPSSVPAVLATSFANTLHALLRRMRPGESTSFEEPLSLFAA